MNVLIALILMCGNMPTGERQVFCLKDVSECSKNRLQTDDRILTCYVEKQK